MYNSQEKSIKDFQNYFQKRTLFQGRRQSPINIAPSGLTYDPALSPLSIDKTLVSGKLSNTGQSLVLK